MTDKVNRRFGIMSVAILMALASLLSGTKGSPYTVFWIYAAYLSYKGDIKTLKSYLVVLIWVNAIIVAGVFLFVDLRNLQWIMPGAEAHFIFLVAVGIPLAIKIAILARIKSLINLESASKFEENCSNSDKYINDREIIDKDIHPSNTPINYREPNKKPIQETRAHTPSDSYLNHLYAVANDEIESDKKDKGLWARCFAESNGNTNEATAKYLKLRVEELSQFENQKSVHQKEQDFLNLQTKNNEINQAKSLYDLAMILSKGNSEFEKNINSALEKMEKSALLGYGRAQYNVSLMYWKGEGVAANYPRAYAWSLIAAEKESDAISNIQFMKSKMSDAEMAQAEKILNEIREQIKSQSL